MHKNNSSIAPLIDSRSLYHHLVRIIWNSKISLYSLPLPRIRSFSSSSVIRVKWALYTIEMFMKQFLISQTGPWPQIIRRCMQGEPKIANHRKNPYGSRSNCHFLLIHSINKKLAWKFLSDVHHLFTFFSCNLQCTMFGKALFFILTPQPVPIQQYFKLDYKIFIRFSKAFHKCHSWTARWLATISTRVCVVCALNCSNADSKHPPPPHVDILGYLKGSYINANSIDSL